MRLAIALTLLAVIVLGLGACASLPAPGGGRPEGSGEAEAGRGSSRPRQPGRTVDGLDLVHETRAGALYARSDHHIGSYDNFQMDTFSLSYMRGQRPLSASAAEKLRAHLEADLRDSIFGAGLEVVAEPNECTLAIQVHLAELELLDTGQSSGSSTHFVTTAGSVMLIFEMRDGVSRVPLVRYGQRRQLPGGKFIGVPGSMSTKGLANAIQSLMGDVGRELATELPPTTVQREVDCEGKIFEASTGRAGPGTGR